SARLWPRLSARLWPRRWGRLRSVMGPLRTDLSTCLDLEGDRPTGLEERAAHDSSARHRGRMIGHPHEIRAMATRLHADADRLRHLAVRVGRTRDLAWRSRAATLFRER